MGKCGRPAGTKSQKVQKKEQLEKNLKKRTVPVDTDTDEAPSPKKPVTSSESLHSAFRLPWLQMDAPPQSLQSAFRLPWLQMDVPPQSLHRDFSLPWLYKQHTLSRRQSLFKRKAAEYESDLYYW
jgi:hypothetical protein